MTAARIFFLGGVMSYRALFGWLSPWVFVPTFLVAPIFQILLFVYIGRSAGVQSDEFYVVTGRIRLFSTFGAVASIALAVQGGAAA